MLGILAWVKSNEFEDDGQAWQVTLSHWDLKVAKPGDLISYCWVFSICSTIRQAKNGWEYDRS